MKDEKSMNTPCVRKLVLLLICVFALTSGLAGIATEHKVGEHKKASQTALNHEKKGTSNSGLDADGNAKKADSGTKQITPEASFELFRQTAIKRFLEYKVSPDRPSSAKLFEAIKPTLTKFINVPLALKDKTVENSTAVLTYQSTDPKIDMSLTVYMVPSGNGWTFSTFSLKGSQGIELQQEILKDITDAFPLQFTLVWVFIFAFIATCVAQTAAMIWLDVAAFRTSLGWGFGTLFIPVVGLIFALVHWEVAKKPFLTLVASVVATFLTFLIPIWVGYSVGDIPSTINDFAPKTDASSVHEI
jgi:hypothetical protein